MRNRQSRACRSFYRVLRDGAAAVLLLWYEADRYARRRLVVAILLALTGSLLAAAAPVIFKTAVDAFPGAPADQLTRGTILLIVAYVLSQWLVRCLNELRRLLRGRAEQRLIHRLSLKVFAHLLSLPWRFHLDRKTGTLSRVLVNGILGYRVLLEHAVFSLLPATVQLAAMAAVLWHLDQPALLVLLGFTATGYLVAYGLGAARVAEPMASASAAEIDGAGIMADGLINLEAVKCFTAERRIEARFDRALARSEHHWARFYRRRVAHGLLAATIFTLSLGAALGISGRDVAQGVMTIGDFVLVNAYFLQLVAPLEMLGVAFHDVAHGIAFIERLLELMAEEPEDPSERQPLAQGSGAEIVFEHVSFSYGQSRPILDDVSFSIPAGRTVAIVGESGAGKSTFVRLLLRFVSPDRGRILFDGIPITEFAPASLRQAIAVVPQETVLFNDTIAVNIAIGAPATTAEEIRQAAAQSGLHELIGALPHGYRTPVGERGMKLSGGEKQRVAIARAALKRPRAFVFDEATSSLDTLTEMEIVSNLAIISKGMTTLLITHRLSTAVNADEILVLKQGKVVERGSHVSLLAKNGAYAALWRAQQRTSGA